MGKYLSPSTAQATGQGSRPQVPHQASPAHTLSQMPLGSEGLLQRLLVMRVLELPVLPLGGPADSHRPNGHPSLGCLGCLRERNVLSAGG